MAADQSNNMVSSSTRDYSCYSDQLQSFHDHQSNNPTEIYNLTTSMEMIGFPPNKNLDTNSLLWKGFLFSGKTTGGNHHPDGAGPPSSSKAVAINEPTTSHDFYQQLQKHDHDQYNTKSDHNFTSSESNVMQVARADSSTTWHDDENNNRLLVDDNDPSNLRSCHVFPCGANERPSQGLSLSLSSNNPSTIGLQSFELRHQQQESRDHMRFFGSKPMNNIQHHQQQMMQQDGFLGKDAAANNILQFQHQAGTGQFQIRSSKYLGPAQELLNEFCNLGTNNKQSQDHHHHQESKHHKSNQWEQDDDQNIGTSSSSKKHSSYSLEFLELLKRKTKLLQMLEEVDRRYKHYCDQMKAVVYSFEAVAGNGAATVYSALASKAMSRHFRCLRDGIVGQIKSTKKAMGEKDTAAAPGGTRGETPRLRVLDQTLRQQKAFQQMNMMETHPWRPQRGLPERSVSVLRAWLFEHFLYPYPSDVDKHILARQTGLSRSQVSNWFINARVRLWKPMVEEMYLEETKEHDNMVSSDGVTTLDYENGGRLVINPNPQSLNEDQKPTPDQLVRIDSECLSSIINNPERNDNNNNKQLQNHVHHHQPHQQQNSFGRITDSFGAVELDFSTYNHHSAGAVSYANDQNFNTGGAGGSGGGVSLTLGLQQHGEGGVGLAFSPASQASLFYPRDHIEECQQVQYSLLDGEGQNLPYRNLMGAQLLHDLAS